MVLSADNLRDKLHSLDIKSNETIGVGVSGGADSLALALLLSEHFNITALTVNHGLRTEAVAECKMVADLMAAHDIPHETLTWTGDVPSSNIQAAARELRYKLMSNWCHSNSVRLLAVAHHMDDQAETFMLRLARGSGVYGLSAMSEHVALHDDLALIRPLLDYSSDQLKSYLTARSIQWIEDPSNENTDFERIKVRKMLANTDVEGLNPERLSKTAKQLRRSKEALDHYRDKWLRAHVSLDEGHILRLKSAALHSDPEEIVLKGLTDILQTISGANYVPRLEKTQRLYDGIMGGTERASTLHGVQIVQDKNGDWLFWREASTMKPASLACVMVWENNHQLKYNGLDVGDYQVRALGKNGWAALVQAYPTAKQTNIPVMARASLLSIWRGEDQLIYVPAVGFGSGDSSNFSLEVLPRYPDWVKI